MNTKAFSFIIRGMLAENEDVAVERIGYMLSKMESAEDMLCDGIITGVEIVDSNALFEYTKKHFTVQDECGLRNARPYFGDFVPHPFIEITLDGEEGGINHRIYITVDSKIPGVVITGI